MGQHVLLNNVDHHDLRLITQRGAAFGDNVNQALIYPTEYQDIQRQYPIFFRQTEGGGFKSVALLGFDKDENLFLQGDRWNAAYVPAVLRVSPFLIGEPKAGPCGELPSDAEAMVLVDPGHARISRSEGERLFIAHGGNSPVLTQMTQVLRQVYAGAQVSDRMFAAFQEAELLAPAEIEVKVSDQQAYVLKDMFIIRDDVLRGLSGNVLKALNQAGFLSLAFYVLSSMGNLNRMISLKTGRAVPAPS